MKKREIDQLQPVCLLSVFQVLKPTTKTTTTDYSSDSTSNKRLITFMWTSNTSSQLQCGFQFQLNDFDTAERDECTFLSDMVTDERPSEEEAFANNSCAYMLVRGLGEGELPAPVPRL